MATKNASVSPTWLNDCKPFHWRSRLAVVALLSLSQIPAALAQTEKPQRLADTLQAPDWLKIEGAIRGRYETLEGQFRSGGRGSDQVLGFRNLVLIEADGGSVAAGLELQDSRAYLDDSGTALTTSNVNPLDVLQAYIRFDLDGAFGSKTASLKLGRQTLDIGSRRVLERVDMANVIFAYTGAYWRSTNERGDELHILAVSPTGRLPNSRAALDDNELSGDEEEWGRRLVGAHYRRADLLGEQFADLWAEVFLYDLEERDTRAVATPNRSYVQPGVRLYRAPKAGHLDFDLEASWRSGTRRQTTGPGDVRDLVVDASMLYAHVGYTFDHPWRPRVQLDYYFASGDEDPDDEAYGQFERLFGARRSDLGHTGIHGPLTTANIDAPGGRIEFRPSDRLDLRLAYKAASLAEARDAWVSAGVQDRSGASGDFIGHFFEARMRYWLLPQTLELEIGASAIINGEFAKSAPNASRQGNTTFGYVQLLQLF
jgi:hypothetical protein